MKENVNTLSLLVNDLINSLDDRTEVFMVNYEPLLQKMLDWHLKIWKLNWRSFKNKSADRVLWLPLHMRLHDGIRKIGIRAIKSRNYTFTVFFLKNFQKHIETHKNETAESTDKTLYYRFYLYSLFFDLLTEFVKEEHNERDFMWERFPADWKITQNNLMNKENCFAGLSYEQFMRWAEMRINWNAEKEYDNVMDDITANLFPEVDPQTWETILIFTLSGYSPDARVKSVIERVWTIGYPSTKYTSFGFSLPALPGATEEKLAEQEKKIIMQKTEELDAKKKIDSQKTCQLAAYLFSPIFTKELLEGYINEATNLNYADGSIEKRRKEKLLEIFNNLLAQ